MSRFRFGALLLLPLLAAPFVLGSGFAHAEEEPAPPAPPVKPAEPGESTEPAAEEAPQRIEQPMLWLVQRDPPLFLFGTIHLPDERVIDLPPVVDEALRGAEIVRTEIKMDMATLMGAQATITKHGSLPSGDTLKGLVGEALYQRVEACVTHPLLKMQLPTSKPWRAFMLVTQNMVLQRYGMAMPVDKRVYDAAAKAGKDVDGLEKLEEQLGVIYGLAEDEQRKMLVQAVEECEQARASGVSPLDAVLHAYLRGDATVLMKDIVKVEEDDALSGRLVDELLHKRNVHMALRVLRVLAEHPGKSLFVAVGAGHMAGETGLVELFGQAGYEVERIERGEVERIRVLFGPSRSAGEGVGESEEKAEAPEEEPVPKQPAGGGGGDEGGG